MNEKKPAAKTPATTAKPTTATKPAAKPGAAPAKPATPHKGPAPKR